MNECAEVEEMLRMPYAHNCRLFRTQWATRFLAEPSLLGVIDTYGIELLPPVRERQKTQTPRIGRKGLSNRRWIVVGKLCNLLAQWNGMKPDKEGFIHLSIAQFSL